MEHAFRRKLRGDSTPPFGCLEHTRVLSFDSLLHCPFCGRMLTIFLLRPAAFYAKIPLPIVGAEHLPAKHCHGAVLQLLMYKYHASFVVFSFSIIGEADNHESLALFIIEWTRGTHYRQFTL